MPSSRSSVSLATADDSALLALVRRGDANAYGELWRRHSAAGLRVAHGFRSSGDADDLVSESFIAVHAALRNGAGPTGAFRPYLYVTIRNLAARKAEANSKFVAHEVDFDALPAQGGAPEEPRDEAFVSSAFRSLPERWQSVIWYVEVEQLRMAEVGALLGIKANAVSALVFRAKSALRVAWLQSQVESGNLVGEHRAVVVQLASYAQNTLRAREADRVAAHLLDCQNCSQIADEVDSLARRIAVVMLPLVLGGSAAGAFMQSQADTAALSAATSLSGGSGAPSNFASAGFRPARAVARTTFAGSLSGVTIATLLVAACLVAVGTIAGFSVFGQLTPRASTDVRPSASPSSPATTRPAEQHPDGETPGSAATPTPLPMSPRVPGLSPKTTSGSGSPAAPNSAVLPIMAGTRPTISGGLADRVTNSGAISVSGQASGGATIIVSEGGTVVAELAVSDSGAWLLREFALADGSHVLDFAERRSGFHESAAVRLIVIVDSVAPGRPTLLSAAGPSDLSAPTFYGRAESGATVVVRDVFGAVLVSVAADATGQWMSGVIAGLRPAETVFSATQSDQANNVSAASTLTLASFAPVFRSPESGGVYNQSVISVRLDGWPGQEVRVGFDGTLGGIYRFSSVGVLDLQFFTGANTPVASSFSLWASYAGSAGVALVHFSTAP